MAEKITFPANSIVICNKWEFSANSVVDTHRSKTGWPRGRTDRLWKRHEQCRNIQNRIREKVSTHELYFGTKPNFRHLRVFGSIGYVHVPKEMQRKLDAKAKRVISVITLAPNKHA